MELPIARISTAKVMNKAGNLTFKDSVYDQVLIGLEPEGINSGDVVAVVKVKTPEYANRPYCFQLFKLTSEYEFVTVNSAHLINRLRERLHELDYELITIAVAYKSSHGWMVGNRPVELYEEFGQIYSRAVN